MSFLTDVTPLTLRATSTALLMSARELTKPLNCTTPLKVSTLISAYFSDGSLKTAVFTGSSHSYAGPALYEVAAAVIAVSLSRSLP
jgi:hypothetical protein